MLVLESALKDEDEREDDDEQEGLARFSKPAINFFVPSGSGSLISSPHDRARAASAN